MDTTLQDPLVGQVLDGRYHVGARLARGGMATVYEAVDTRLDRPVALKVMHSGLAADDEFVARFIREAKSAARLSHPNVVAVFDQGSDNGNVFLAMEYVQGQTLRDALRRHGRLTPREALGVLEPVLAALGAAHQAGIVHRDVKPENVLLADDGRVKVADFGLARAVSAGTNTTASRGMLLGTVSYLSPEQVERGIADPRSDVYAAGILLFELLTGSKPHDGDSPIQVAYQHVHDDVPPPSSRVPGIDPALDALVARATSRDPDGRPDDANRFLAELVAVRRSLPLEALDAQRPEMTSTLDRTLVVPRPQGAPAAALPAATHSDATPAQPPRRRRRRSGLIALFLVLLLAAGLAGAGWWLGAGPGTYTSAPSLLGLSRSAAEAKAADAGLGVRYDDPQFSETVAADHVLSTDPAPNGRVKKDGSITVVLSKGKERYPVPDLRGLTEQQAAAKLAESHLSIGTTTRQYSDRVPTGRVVSTSPGSGAKLKRDEAVSVVVSRGMPPVKVPSYVGKSAEDATKALTKLGFKVTATETISESVDKGDVVSQSPKSGTALKGSTISLVVSKGPPLVEVPNVLDKKVGDARQILTDAGFKVRVRGTQILNRVFNQSPGRGSMAPKGSTVTLITI